jgi:hypothetical protein
LRDLRTTYLKDELHQQAPPSTKTKVRLHNAAVNNRRPSRISTMKAMQYKTGLDPENIAYYFKDESNNNKLRSASGTATATTDSIAVPAVFKAGHMR